MQGNTVLNMGSIFALMDYLHRFYFQKVIEYYLPKPFESKLYYRRPLEYK